MLIDHQSLRNVNLLLTLAALLYDIIFSSVKHFRLATSVLKMSTGLGYKENEASLIWFCRQFIVEDNGNRHMTTDFSLKA